MAYGVEEIGNPRSKFVDKYLEGLVGVEIGYAAHNDFGLNTEIRTCGQHDYPSPGVTHYIEDLYDHSLPFVPTKHYDFVFGSHILEHLFNPIGALREHARGARRYVVHVLPHPDRMFDKGRPLTTLEELLARPSRPTPEMLRFEPYGGHWNVWTPATFPAVAAHVGLEVVEMLNPDDKVANGFIVVMKEMHQHCYGLTGVNK